MTICRKIVKPAKLGEYELHVGVDGPNVTVTGARAVNGAEEESWTQSDLVQGSPRTFSVHAGERHRVKVFATFDSSDDKVSVDLQYGGNVIESCELKKDGHTSSDMSVLAPATGT